MEFRNRVRNRFARFFQSPHCLFLAVLLLLGLIWSSIMFCTVYPYPARWDSDATQYLMVAQSIAHSGQAHSGIVNIENMVRLHMPYPQHEYVLGGHFPSYSGFLAIFLLCVRNTFAAVCLSQTLLFLGIIALTYYFTYHFTSNRKAAFISAVGVTFSPTLSLYLSITMSEIFVVFLTMLTIFLALRPQEPKNHLILAIVLSLLVITRFDFLILCLPVFVYRIMKTDRAKAYWTVPILLLPLLTNFTLGRNGFLYYQYLQTQIWHNVIHNTLNNLHHIFNYHFSFRGEAIYEFLMYVGILVVLISLVKFHKKPLYRIIAFTHFGILAGILLFYNWYDWREIRMAMWFVPFAYVLFISLFMSIRTKPAKVVLIIAALILLVPMISLNKTLILGTLPAQKAAMQQATTQAQQIKAYLDENYPEAKFILVPAALEPVALLDHQRIYCMPYPTQIEQALPSLDELQFFFDVAFVPNSDFERLKLEEGTAVSWDKVYKIEKSPFDGITILVNRAIN